jgi:hypothetical protein
VIDQIHGCVGGWATMTQLEEKIESLDLSSAGQEELRTIGRRFGK